MNTNYIVQLKRDVNEALVCDVTATSADEAIAIALREVNQSLIRAITVGQGGHLITLFFNEPEPEPEPVWDAFVTSASDGVTVNRFGVREWAGR